ncbi:MAG: spore maturation protein A [Clostridia bacterium]|nr:spore maturation protein A [Clostridia bacterium]
MMNYIWAGMIIISIICAVFQNNTSQLSSSILSSAGEAVELVISMTGAVCLWSGIMEIAEKSGAAKAAAKLLSPVLSKLFPNLDKNGKAFTAICSNVTANLLGLGNAATPLGIKAMQEIVKEESAVPPHTATKSTAAFMILNTASFQLMPTMIISVLLSAGCSRPNDIIVPIWISSIVGLSAALCAVNIFYPKKRKL